MFACPPRNPATRQLLEGDAWKLLEPFWFSWRGDCHPPIFETVPCHFITDGLSIPRLYRWRFSASGPGFRAAIAHDWLYRQAIVPRHVCDQVFRDGLEFCGVGWWERNVMWATLKVGGGIAYGKSRRRRLDEAEARGDGPDT
jgi:hypothetical protein